MASAGLPILQPSSMSTSTSVSTSTSHEPGPTAQALHALWAETATTLRSFAGWRRTFWLRRRFDLRFMSLDGLRVLIPTGQLPDCDNCLDVCCAGPNAVVSLRLHDIATLIDLQRTELIAFHRPPTSSKDSVARRAADETIFHQAFPTLARDATGTCQALTEDRLCGLYPAWPLSCARYPYALDTINKVVFYAAGCHSTRLASVEEAPVAVRDLVRATVDAYNARVRDVLLLAVAWERLEALGLLRFLKVDALQGLRRP